MASFDKVRLGRRGYFGYYKRVWARFRAELKRHFWEQLAVWTVISVLSGLLGAWLGLGMNGLFIALGGIVGYLVLAAAFHRWIAPALVDADVRGERDEALRREAAVTAERDAAREERDRRPVGDDHARELVDGLRAVAETVDRDEPVVYGHPVLKDALRAHFPAVVDLIAEYEVAREAREVAMMALEARFDAEAESRGLSGSPYQPLMVRSAIWQRVRDYAMLKPDGQQLIEWTRGSADRECEMFADGMPFPVAVHVTDSDYDAMTGALERFQVDARCWPELLALHTAELERRERAKPVLATAAGRVHAGGFWRAESCPRCQVV